MTPHAIYRNICQFIETYKTPPDKNTPEALDMLSDFALCVGYEFHFQILPKKGTE